MACRGQKVEAEIRGAVTQGRTARIAASNITLNRWSGTGYILTDPLTGAATYPISGGMAGGSTTGEATQGIRELLGSEPWLQGSPLGELLQQLLALLGGGGGSSGGAPSTTQSDPINVSSGNMHRTTTDFSIIARGIPVALTRTYNSRSAYSGPFGYGWTFNYGEQLTENPDGSVTYRESDGTEHLFTRNTDNTYTAPPGKHVTLSRADGEGSQWRLKFKDGLLFTFDAAGHLIAQTDLNANTITINRDPNANPTTIVDAAGRTVLTFTMTGNKITTITDLANRQTLYTYNGDDLVSVTDTAGKIWTMEYDLGHNMTRYADPLSNAQSYDYDTDDRMFHHIDANGAEEFFHFDIAGRQSVITDRRGGDRFIEFDDSGRATVEADPAGNVVRASFDAGNNRTSVVDSRGFTTTFDYDASGNQTKQTNPDTGTISTTYDASSRPLTSTDALGVTTTNTYDASGNLLTSSRNVSGATETTTNTYDSTGQLLTTTDPNNATTTNTWNSNGTLATRKDAANQITTMVSDDLGRITSIKDPLNHETTLTYDGRERIKTMTDPYTNITTFTYDDAGRRTVVTTPRGTTSYNYDAEGRVLMVTDPLGNKTSTSYNAAGDVLSRTDARGNVTRYEYDLAGRVTKMTDPAGGIWLYAYCAALGGGSGCSSCGGGGGSFCELTDPNGNTIKQEFDNMGRVVTVTDSLGHSTFTQYDKAGRKTLETDANGNATQYGYDEAGRLLLVKEASGAITRYSYDKNGNKLAQTDANSHTWSFRYDALNRLIEEKDPLNRITSYTYDELGNLKTKTDAKNQIATYSYNIRRLTGVTYSDGTGESYTYDSLGRRITASNANVTYVYGYDALNRLTSVKNQTRNLTATYEYDAAGNRTKMTLPRNIGGNPPPFETKYVYDAKNRLTTIDDSFFGKFRFAYDPMDRRTSLQYPNGTSTAYTYDNGYRLTALVTKTPTGEVLDAWSYTYDAVGNRTSKVDMNGARELYQYDPVYRLTDATYGDGSYEKFAYDPVGNRISLVDGNGTTNYAYDAANQMLSAGSTTFGYDANGNTITKTIAGSTPTNLTYDIKNRLTAISGGETNKYAPDGQRVEMTNNPVDTNQVAVHYDLSGNPVLDWRPGQLDVWVYRLYGPGIDEVLGEWHRDGNTITYLHHDALGSVTAASTPTGAYSYRATYKAFGQMTRTPAYNATRIGFTGREISTGSLMNYRSRYYDTAPGRFLQQDGYTGDGLVPPSLHRYTYVHNNPVRYIDPSGMFINGFMATVGVAAIAALFLGVHNDKVAHFLSGYAWTVLLVGGLLALVPNMNTSAGVVIFVLISILIGTLLEALYFNKGGFDKLDWFAQTLGAMLAGLLWLQVLSTVSVVANMGSEMIAPLCYWSVFHIFLGLGIYSSDVIRRYLPTA